MANQRPVRAFSLSHAAIRPTDARIMTAEITDDAARFHQTRNPAAGAAISRRKINAGRISRMPRRGGTVNNRTVSSPTARPCKADTASKWGTIDI
jgi:hypothetical protein